MGDKVALRYPKAIYREEVVRHAISDYRHICKIDLAKDDSAIVCTLIGITILVAGLVTPLQEGFDGSRMLLTFLVDIPGMIFISGGIGLFVYYFAGKKMLAKELGEE